MLFPTIVLIASVFVCALLFVGLMRKYALRRALVDVPNLRSSHTVPTPRGGGVGIVIPVLCALVFLCLTGNLSKEALIGLGGGGLVVAGIGYLDDHSSISPLYRIIFHFLAALLVTFSLDGLPPIALPWGLWSFGFIGFLLVPLFVVWCLNLYNFMDGIDGIAAIEAITVGLGAWYLLRAAGADGLASAVMIYVVACAAFSIWNWPPAKIFMGDIGSGFLGFSFGAFVVITFSEAGISPWAWLILLGVFIVDATITLLVRVARGERWYEAHCSHAYQHASRRHGSHRPVTIGVALLNVFWLWPLAWQAQSVPQWGLGLMLLAWAPLVALAIHYKAGHKKMTIGQAS